MIVGVDGKAIEWVCASFLAQDKTAHKEIWEGIDQHTENQKRFGLPDRLTAKTFVFRLIYGGQAYSYAHDPDFTKTSSSEKFWQKVIEEFYTKYFGIANWHVNLIREASSTGQINMCTGRIYNFKPTARGDWPRTTILNYPVQGLAADLMAIARVLAFKYYKEQKLPGLFVSTIHDSIVADVPDNAVDDYIKLYRRIFEEIPQTFELLFGTKFTLPTRCEVSVGPDKYNLTEVK